MPSDEGLDLDRLNWALYYGLDDEDNEEDEEDALMDGALQRHIAAGGVRVAPPLGSKD